MRVAVCGTHFFCFIINGLKRLLCLNLPAIWNTIAFISVDTQNIKVKLDTPEK